MSDDKTELELIIGNKNYSSWSLRPWIAMKVANIPFTEVKVPFDFDNDNRHLLDYSPSKKVPVLQHGDLTVWDSLAILEYLAELHPEKQLWPSDPEKRALARSISCQMHSGFTDLRNECPMNMRRDPQAISVSAGVERDVAIIEGTWFRSLETSNGPFLFGDFSIVDAMFAPVVNRLLTYELSSDATTLSYCSAMTALPAWKEWTNDARTETWIIESSEL